MYSMDNLSISKLFENSRSWVDDAGYNDLETLRKKAKESEYFDFARVDDTFYIILSSEENELKFGYSAGPLKKEELESIIVGKDSKQVRKKILARYGF